jgi:hypothetical protein
MSDGDEVEASPLDTMSRQRAAGAGCSAPEERLDAAPLRD